MAIKIFVPRLPREYQEVEYIESDSGQWIDTELEGKNGYTFETKVIFTSLVNTYTYLAGFGTSSSNRIYFTRAQKNLGTDGYTFTAAMNSGTTISLNTTYIYESIMETGYQRYYRNGILIGAGSNTTLNAYSTIWLFTADYNGSSNGGGAVKMYYAKFSYGGVVVANFIPCYRKADGVIGMYDTIRKKFYQNIGNRSFVKGADLFAYVLKDCNVTTLKSNGATYDKNRKNINLLRQNGAVYDIIKI